MPYCKKCREPVGEEMLFCPNCGAALKSPEPTAKSPVVAPASPATQLPATQPRRAERYEKEEKREKEEKVEKSEKAEKHEKYEKQEKGEEGYIVSAIAGLVLIILGFLFYISIVIPVDFSVVWPVFLVLVGVVVIALVLYGSTTAGRRSPRP
jgi:hypothetical protein